MDKTILNLTYASSLTKLCEVNSSFDSGVLRIAYTGANRNRSFISKKTFEKCIKTIFNCPIVCNYDRESDTLGGHDMEVVRNSDGSLSLINTTTPVGCIPESSHIFWENVEEEDGTVHEYLCAEVLLWKRQEAYKKIKQDGIVAHSMEITVKDGESIDGIYHIKDFEFTAFALIGVEPCFESSSLEVFSKKNFKEQLSEMMLELKESFTLVKTSGYEGDNTFNNHSTEGGKQILEKNELITKYGIDVSALDFSIDDYTVEELEEKFKAMQANPNSPEGEPISKPNTEDKFALISNIVEEIRRSLETVKLQKEWGECDRFWFVDCDIEANEVYCWDTNDWLLYGFSYAMDGDSVIIDFDSKKRKKYVIADFDEGEQASPFAQFSALLEQKIHDNAEWEEKYQTASNTINSMENELSELREFKSKTENAIVQGKRDEIFAQFADLNGIEAFENLKGSCDNYDLETIEEKCFAIRGRLSQNAKFTLEPKTPKIKVEKTNTEDLPYGGIFEKYGFSAEN